MSNRLRARMQAGVCALLVVVSSAGCQTIYPSSRPYTGIGATRNAAGDVIILVRNCAGNGAVKLQLSVNGAILWEVTSPGDASPVIRMQVGQVASGWREELSLSSRYEGQDVYGVSVWFSKGKMVNTAIPFGQTQAGIVISDAGLTTEDEFLQLATRCGSPITTSSTRALKDGRYDE